jgi:hypothetical protein
MKGLPAATTASAPEMFMVLKKNQALLTSVKVPKQEGAL